jgi:hypothetical protein
MVATRARLERRQFENFRCHFSPTPARNLHELIDRLACLPGETLLVFRIRFANVVIKCGLPRGSPRFKTCETSAMPIHRGDCRCIKLFD